MGRSSLNKVVPSADWASVSDGINIYSPYTSIL